MSIEKQITKYVEDKGCSRLEAIASMNLGERSKAAERALKNRARRKELIIDYNFDFDIACLIINQENLRFS